MPDREKVVKGLEYCIADEYCDECPYENNCFGINDEQFGEKLLRDALALIDTQYKLILELQNLISIGTKMMNGGEVDEIPGDP